MWSNRNGFCLKAAGHWSHLKGFSPVWFLMWTFRFIQKYEKMKKRSEKVSKSLALPSILVSDERIYRIPGKDRVCRSCGDARDIARAVIFSKKNYFQ